MDWIIQPRRSGKTTEIIRICAEAGGYIVCHDQCDAHRIFQQARCMGLSIHFPLTYYELLNKDYYGRGVGRFHIEDVSDLLRYLAGPVPIATATLSPDALVSSRNTQPTTEEQ